VAIIPKDLGTTKTIKWNVLCKYCNEKYLFYNYLQIAISTLLQQLKPKNGIGYADYLVNHLTGTIMKIDNQDYSKYDSRFHHLNYMTEKGSFIYLPNGRKGF